MQPFTSGKTVALKRRGSLAIFDSIPSAADNLTRPKVTLFEAFVGFGPRQQAMLSG
jgi:hypothetical protein